MLFCTPISQKTKMLMILTIYKIILSDYEFSDPPEPGCYEKPIFVLRDDESMKELFNAAMKAAATGADFFQIEKDGRTLKYTILETKQVDQALAAQYQIPQDIDWTDDELHTVTFYFKSNKCFREKHHCTACLARIKPKPEYKSFMIQPLLMLFTATNVINTL